MAGNGSWNWSPVSTWAWACRGHPLPPPRLPAPSTGLAGKGPSTPSNHEPQVVLHSHSPGSPPPTPPSDKSECLLSAADALPVTLRDCPLLCSPPPTCPLTLLPQSFCIPFTAGDSCLPVARGPLEAHLLDWGGRGETGTLVLGFKRVGTIG